MNPLLSILIPSLSNRKEFFDRINYELCWQKAKLPIPDEIEIVSFIDEGKMSTGFKRNWLMQNCRGEYTCFIDDDDMPTDLYIKKQLDVAKSGLDCGSFRGLYFEDGIYDRPFIHSTKYSKWFTDNLAHYRSVNHLNAVKKELAIAVPFENIYIGEDHKWSERAKELGVFKTEYIIEETLYLYYNRKNK